MSDFVLNFFQVLEFEQKCAFKKTRYDWIYPVKWTNSAFLFIFRQNDSDAKINYRDQIFERNFYKVSDF